MTSWSCRASHIVELPPQKRAFTIKKWSSRPRHSRDGSVGATFRLLTVVTSHGGLLSVDVKRSPVRIHYISRRNVTGIYPSNSSSLRLFARTTHAEVQRRAATGTPRGLLRLPRSHIMSWLSSHHPTHLRHQAT